MSRKKRQTVTLLVLCLVLIAAGVGYYALIRHQAAQEKAEKAKEKKKAEKEAREERIEKRKDEETEKAEKAEQQQPEYLEFQADTIEDLVDAVSGYAYDFAERNVLTKAESEVGQSFDFRG